MIAAVSTPYTVPVAMMDTLQVTILILVAAGATGQGWYDVSTLKELALRWAPHVAQAFQKSSTHLALDDVRESIRELQFYRERLLRQF